MDHQEDLYQSPHSRASDSQLSQTCPSWEMYYKARVLRPDEWEDKRHAIAELCIDKNLSLADTRKTMAEEHKFYANEGQYKRRIRKWGLEKNLNKKTVSGILGIQERRKLEGKPTSFRYNGRQVEESKLERSRKRLGADMATIHRKASLVGLHELYKEHDDAIATPLGVEYFTPSPGTGIDTGDPRPWEAMIKAIESTNGGSSESCEDYIMEDIEPHVTPAPPGSINTDSPPYVMCPRDQRHSQMEVTTNLEYPDEPIRIFSSDDQTAPRLTCTEWVSIGLRSTIGSWIEGGVVTSGKSPFNSNRNSDILMTFPNAKPSALLEISAYNSQLNSNSPPRRRSDPKTGLFAPCCGVSFYNIHSMIGHYEEHHGNSFRHSWIMDSEKENHPPNNTTGIPHTATIYKPISLHPEYITYM